MKNNFWKEQLSALLCSLAALCLYLYSLSPSVQGFDSAELTMGAFDLGFVHPPGYPLYLTIGHLFTRLPFGDVGFRMNLMSAVFASLSVYLLFILLYRQSCSLWAAFIFTGLFAANPAFWSQAIRAEVYTLHIFLVTASISVWFIGYTQSKRGAYFISFLLLGLSAGNHPTTILLWVPALLVSLMFYRNSRRTILIANIFAVLLAGLSYLYFPWRANANLQVDYIRPYFQINPGSLSGLFWMISGRPFQCLLLNQGNSCFGLDFLHLLNFLWTGSLGLGLFFAAWGWIDLGKRYPLWNLLLTIYFAANLLMFLMYQAVDKEVMFLPLFLLLSVWSASGLPFFIQRVAGLQTTFDHPTIHLLLGTGLLTVIIVALFSDLPDISLRNDRRVYDYARQLLLEAEPDAVIASHWATASVIDYLRIVEGLRPDVESLNVDFYFLSIQQDCRPPSDQDLLTNGWVPSLLNLSQEGRLCFIEPLHGLPQGYTWANNSACWQIERQDIDP